MRVLAVNGRRREGVIGFSFLCPSPKQAATAVERLRLALEGDSPEAQALRDNNDYGLAVKFVDKVLGDE